MTPRYSSVRLLEGEGISNSANFFLLSLAWKRAYNSNNIELAKLQQKAADVNWGTKF